MQSPLSWLGLRPRVRAGAHDDRDVLSRLRKTLDRAEVQYSKEAPELGLSSLPVSQPPQRALRIQAQRFFFPLPVTARIALLESGFHVDRNLREFDTDDVMWLHSYAPDAIVVPLVLALDLAQQKLRGTIGLPTLKLAMIVLTSLGDSPLTDEHRDVLWRAFEVPLFEQLRAWDGTVVARECEVHDGLHVDQSVAIFHRHEAELLATMIETPGTPIIRARTGLTGDLIVGSCECGQEAIRLLNLAAVVISENPVQSENFVAA